MNACPVESLQDGPPRKSEREAAALKTTRGSDDRNRQMNHAPASPESPHEIQVLENRKRLEPADLSVSGRPDEDAGVAIAKSELSQLWV